MKRLFQSKLLIKLIFILALVLLFSTGSLQAATSPDAIAFRVMPNSDHLSPRRWYQENIKVKGSPQALVVDGYEAVRDGRTVYVNAANIDLSNGHCSNDQSRACSTNNPCASGGTCVPTFYSNIYIISYNQQAENATVDIFGQILSHWKFNANITDQSQKEKIIRDTKRLADLADMESALANYQAGPSGDYPSLAAGSYIAGKSISTWPSWRATLSKDLAITLPLDPVNKLGDCSSPPGYNPTTCWNQTTKKFADLTDDGVFNLPADSHAYVYSYNGNKSYNLCAIMESGYLTTLSQGACVGSAVGHAVTCTDTVWTPKYNPANVCTDQRILETSNCGKTRNILYGSKIATAPDCAANTCVGKTCDTGCATIKGALTGGNCGCAANSGRPCASSPNNCGQTNASTYNCAGFCSATPPANVTITCSANTDCDDVNACTTDICNSPGTCSATCSHPVISGTHLACSNYSCVATANTSSACSNDASCSGKNAGSACNCQPTSGDTCNSSTANNCGEYGRGTYNCAGFCSATPPADVTITCNNTNNPNQPNCQTGAPVNSEINASGGICCSGQTCYKCATGYAWDGTSCQLNSPACTDVDGDTYDICNPGEAGDDGKPKDCDDAKNFIKPGAIETCDTFDNNCSSQIDEGCDNDRDGYCDNSMQIYNNTSMCANTTFTGDGMYGDDCDDTDASKHPGGASCQTALIVSILYPTTFEFLANNYITFSASAMGGSFPYKYAWQSSLDGNLYTGYADSFSTKTLSVGTHAIALTVTDNLNLTSTKTFNLTIKAAGSFFAVLNSPQNGNQFLVGSAVWFNTFVSGGTSLITYSWVSDRTGGEISNLDNFSISTLPLGDNKITVTVTDATGAAITKFVNIKIISGLLLNLYSPESGTYEQGATVSFNAHVSGGTSPYTYIWSSDKDGTIASGGGDGAGGSFTKNDLSINTHLITVTATDSLGATASQSVTIEIVQASCLDDDQDGYGKIVSPACANKQADCDDTNPNIKPGATEICGNTVDENCNGSLTDCPASFTVISPASDGLTFAWGSKLNIKIQGTPITSAYIAIYDSTNKYFGGKTLYNDGTHNDGAANDDIWGVDTPLIFPDGNYYLNATINTVNYTKIRNFSINNAISCTTVVNNGASADKLDIVFVAAQYTSAEMPVFIAKVQSAYTYLFGLKPFDTQKSKINIHRLDSPNMDINQAFSIANYCPRNQTVIIANSNFRSYAFKGTGLAVVSALDSRFTYVVAHEIGHSFGGLDDEYVEAGKSTDPGSVNASVNCDTSPTCTKWNAIPGTGCFGGGPGNNGCDYMTIYYRSVYNGIMRNVSTDFGVINIDQINKIFNTSYR